MSSFNFRAFFGTTRTWTDHREVLVSGPLEIAYGTDAVGGYFLSVCDTRLRSDLPHDAADLIQDKFPDGDYVRFKVEGYGVGERISIEAMRSFWRKFGVSEEKCQEIMGMRGASWRFDCSICLELADGSTVAEVDSLGRGQWLRGIVRPQMNTHSKVLLEAMIVDTGVGQITG